MVLQIPWKEKLGVGKVFASWPVPFFPENSQSDHMANGMDSLTKASISSLRKKSKLVIW
jgi:hypothetical protein